jgi:hypothetical protein
MGSDGFELLKMLNCWNILKSLIRNITGNFHAISDSGGSENEGYFKKMS